MRRVSDRTNAADTPLFRRPVHSDGPPAERVAEVKAETGKRATAVLDALRAHLDMWADPPTAGELAKTMKAERHYVARGFSDLAAAGKAKHAGTRECRASGKRLTTWETT